MMTRPRRSSAGSLSPLTSRDQLIEWVAGRSKHRGPRSSGECCPDFSCCEPALLALPSERTAFFQASKDERWPMLLQFLGRLLALHQVNARIAGAPDEVQPFSKGGDA